MDKKRSYNQKNKYQNQRLRVGDTIPLKIKRLGINGEGIGYFQRTICFIKGALPGEQVIAKITDIKPRFIIGETAKIKMVSPDRVEPRDSFANNVGGFELEHLSYAAQLEFKRDVIKQSLAKFRPEGYKQFDLRPTIGMDDPTGYRNKAQFQVRRLDGKVLAGMYTEGSHDLVDLPEVSVQHPLTMQIMRFIVDLLDKYSVSVYNERKNIGDVKTIIVRVAVETNQAQVVFVTNSTKLPYRDEMVEDLQAKFPEIKSIMQNINSGRNSLIWGDNTQNIAGDSFITEKMDGLSFKLSARAFFQLNPYQTVKLYNEARKALELSDNDNLVDAYSGVGTIGLSLAKKAKEVRGMDTIAEAVEDANENAKLNGIDNAHYETGAAEKLLPKWLQEGFKPDSLVVDPPRVGLEGRLIQAILTSLPKHFVYISCNPSTLARDLVPLVEKYRVEYIQSIDMFPETARVEAVVKLTLK
ncbi:23S rRNA (uracil(1939)-C(5))-methyltransferase RlmD [Pediococcus claussenii]|uniref:23S rRNA (Uracil-5-)-methyltransferase RumA n=1 Tax=Pediococcus claussenii (strain ATCC BAA-344 / DSM 14800 / JCM 18046 / KCTC 3811 / LMG 21948 / P06) TaxID=701521 RepID=G8PBB3_PEDCP|nr:23S rRNA (uracil(1939)-C(5))-methyltransferase RlmD [Pediococcus claussenii]AEV95902.1 23S rRNA (uracil-5-)-methyltransferase RumA [Pediococcus claussenii ATCC BAA-344]ANZ69393.1 23S rRNA (uracil-5-)-methyltransferase RumA [Pediococcus claussenii]ANZ71213.1 23S rRNA (uracil-5-)-methyltransferase RumA [Pediococcus claussenii]KRN20507.1 rumA protein [Pediococcus claussenii]